MDEITDTTLTLLTRLAAALVAGAVLAVSSSCMKKPSIEYPKPKEVSELGLSAIPWAGWTPPVVKVCDGWSPWTVDEVRWAAGLIHQVGGPDLKVVSSYCLEHQLGYAIEGFIYIAGLWQGEDLDKNIWRHDTLAVTYNMVTVPRTHAAIHTRTDDPRVLVHELVHTLINGPNAGHVDSKVVPHVINPYIENFSFEPQAWAGIPEAFANSQWQKEKEWTGKL